MTATPEQLYLKALKYAQQHGVHTVEKSTGIDRPFRWDGVDLAVNFLYEDPVFQIVHEVNHFRCAPLKRRFKPEYGLGKAATGWGTPEAVVKPLTAETEERMVATLDVAVLTDMGAPPEDVWQWWHDVWPREAGKFYEPGRGWVRGWTNTAYMHEYDSCVNKLKRKGLLTNEGEAIIARVLPLTDKMLRRGLKCPT